MHNRHLFLLALTAVVSSCTSVPKNAITIDRYRELDRSPKLVARQFRISCSLVDAKGTITQFPVLTAKPGQEISVKTKKELVYPTKFDLPVSSKRNASGAPDPITPTVPITPTTPTVFELRELGDHLSLTARLRGPYVEISGLFVSESYAFSSRGAGEALSPITDSKRRYLLTENKATLPQIKRIESFLYVVGLPATAHTIHLDEQNSDLIIKCEAIQ
jgi:hypothetical protein